MIDIRKLAEQAGLYADELGQVYAKHPPLRGNVMLEDLRALVDLVLEEAFREVRAMPSGATEGYPMYEAAAYNLAQDRALWAIRDLKSQPPT